MDKDKDRDFNFKAVILDMDGVITQTVKLHMKAWKETFDNFLEKREGSGFKPFETRDYKIYIDGIPRFDGVRNFLKSREIDLPEGGPEDVEDEISIHSIGMKKNKVFRDLLETEGIEVFPDTLKMIKKWKNAGKKLAVISSSRNCEYIIESAGLTDIFEARVDGETLKEENLKGKPEPDIFLRASELLGVSPDQAIVIEDAILGVEAGKKGRFSLVVGVARDGEEKDLEEAGADIIVKELTELERKLEHMKSNNTKDLPHAILNINEIFSKLENKVPALFLDYDGTLTPIVSDPEKALLSDINYNTISKLAALIPVAVISGRDRANVASKINIDSLIYAGSHGYDITGPNGLDMQYGPGQETLLILDKAEFNLKSKLADINGAVVERKKYAIAVHYRNVDEEDVEEVKKIVNHEIEQHPKIKEGLGKKIIELKPDLDWHKGKALDWILDKLDLKSDRFIPIFIGDDITDEDALEVIKDYGIGIMVGNHDETSYANYILENTDEVGEFLQLLTKHISTFKKPSVL